MSENKTPSEALPLVNGDIVGIHKAELDKLLSDLNDLRGQIQMLKPAPQPAPNYPTLIMPPSPDKNPEFMPRLAGDQDPLVIPDPRNSPVPPPAPGVNRILIAIPLLMVTYEFLESFLKFWTELQSSKRDYEVAYHFAYRRPVHMAEEYLVKVAQQNKCTHILFMDDDIYDVTKKDLDALLAADKDVIGGVMHASKFPHAMCVFRRYNDQLKVTDMPVDTSIYRLYEVPCRCKTCQNDLSHWDIRHCPVCGEEQNQLIQQADLIPFAFTLMKLSVFDKIKQPWFHCTTSYPTDSWLADRLIEAGMTEYAHMGVRLNHNGVTDESKPHLMNLGMIKARKNNGVVELTPAQMDIHQNMLINKMKEVENKQNARPAFTKDGQVTTNKLESDYTLISNVK